MVTQRTRASEPVSPKTRKEAPGGSRAAKAAIRREQLLSTALALFCEHGYAATSTRRIAESAGVAEGLLFHYFSTKEELLLELAARRHTFAGRVLTLVQKAGEGTARELFFSVAGGLADVSEEEAAFIGFLNAEAQVNPLVRSKFTGATAVVLDGLVRNLARHVDAGELRAEASLAATVHGFFGGFSFFFSQHRQLGAAAWRQQASAFAQEWADQCWRGIATPKAMSTYSMKPKRRKTR